MTVYPSCTSRSPKKIRPTSHSLVSTIGIAISLRYYQRLSFAHQSVGAWTPGGKAALDTVTFSTHRPIKHVPYGVVSGYFVGASRIIYLSACRWLRFIDRNLIYIRFFMNEWNGSKLKNLMSLLRAMKSIRKLE